MKLDLASSSCFKSTGWWIILRDVFRSGKRCNWSRDGGKVGWSWDFIKLGQLFLKMVRKKLEVRPLVRGYIGSIRPAAAGSKIGEIRQILPINRLTFPAKE